MIHGSRHWERTRILLGLLLAMSFLLFVFLAASTSAREVTTDEQRGRRADALLGRRNLFGDWNGERTRLAEVGVTFEFYYVADLEGNPRGGEEQARAGWGRFRGTIDADLGRAVGAKGLTFHATGVWQFGANLGAKIGTIANPSGLVSAHAGRLDSWWLQQAFCNSKVFVTEKYKFGAAYNGGKFQKGITGRQSQGNYLI